MKFIHLIILFLPQVVFSQSIELKFQPDGVLFSEASKQILFYRSQGVESQGDYQRPHYVHPLYSLDGEIITEDYPEDHLHHHGIFWAWHQLYIGNRRIGDGWENKNFEWTVLSVEEEETAGPAKRIVIRVHWTSPLWLDKSGGMVPFVAETTKITVHPAEREYRLIDFEIAMQALNPEITIGGSEDPKGYGGFSPRVKLPEDIRFSDLNGEITPQTNPVNGNGWLDMSGSLGKDGKLAGMSILSHSNNPGYPNPWILRSKRSMQNAVYPFPGATPVALSASEPTVLRYRLVVHNGLKSSEIDRLHKQYCQ